MKIVREELLAGARRAIGLAVVIDVFRATSHLVTLLARGAEAVVPVATLATARKLKREHPDWILAGERQGLPPPGFELGNSPFEAEARDFTGRTVILATSAGSKGLVAAAQGADEVVAGCFLNAPAVVEYIRRRRPATVCLVALGVAGKKIAPEDRAAGDYLEALLQGRTPDFAAMQAAIAAHPEGQKFLDPQNPNYRVEDFHACLRVGVHTLVPVLHDGRLTPA